MKLKSKTTWSQQHHQLHQLLSHPRLAGKRYLLMTSGGADSMAALKIWFDVLSDQNAYAVFHYHHGPIKGQSYRDLAMNLVKETCVKHKISFFLSQNKEGNLESEASLRRARYEAAREVMKQNGFHYLVTAHHLEDLLETRLMRLIRGTSDAGLRAISIIKSDLLRPWIRTSKKDLHQILMSSPSWNFVDDPSNHDRQNLRNWIRHEWLVSLEKKVPKGPESLAKSLEQMVCQLRSESLGPIFKRVYDAETRRLDHLAYLEMEKETQKRIIARIYREHDQKNYTAFGVSEVLKQLDKTKEGHIFKVQGLTWLILGQYVMIKTES